MIVKANLNLPFLNLTVIAASATPDDERNYGVEGDGKRSRNFLADEPRNLT